MKANMYRDVYLKDITEEQIGQTLKVSGWVENIRDHGGVSFIDLRDMYGVLQVVMRDTSLLTGIVKEDCVSITGLIESVMKKLITRRSRQERSSWKQRRYRSLARYINRFRLK